MARTRRLNAFAWTAIALLALLVALVLFLAFFNWNYLRGPIARMASERLGRTVTVEGPLDVRALSLTPSLHVKQLQIEGLAEVGQADLQIRLPPLLQGKGIAFTSRISTGDTVARAQGTLAKPLSFSTYEANVALSGQDLADLYYLTGLALPNTPAYQITGHVRRRGEKLHLTQLNGKIGRSDLHGDLWVDTSGERARLTANLSSGSLNLADLAASLGTQTSKPQGKLFPDAKLQLERVRAMDADVHLRAEAIQVRKVPLRKVALHLKLDNGLLRLDPIIFTLPQGKLAGTVHVNAREDLPQTQLDMRISGMRLGQFRSRKTGASMVEGTLHGRARLEGKGASVHDVAASADGNATFVLPRGKVREAFVELTGINVARGLGLMLTDDKQETGVRCAVADFKIRDGTLQAQNIVFDTEDLLVKGEGDIDLEAERLNLSIKGEPKKLRLLRVRSPILITGPLRKPAVGVEVKEAAKQAGIAAVVAAVAAPIAAALAFIDPGLAEDADCSKLLGEATGKTRIAQH